MVIVDAWMFLVARDLFSRAKRFVLQASVSVCILQESSALCRSKGRRCDVFDALMIANVVAVLGEGSNLSVDIREVMVSSRIQVLQDLVPTLVLGLRL